MLTLTASTVNGVTIRTADLNEWDDCPKCIYSQVHLVSGHLACLDSCGFVSA